MNKSRQRLLVVDDDPEFVDIVREICQQQNYDVETVTDSRQFGTAFDSFHPTVIVLDIVMPQLDGIEIIRWLVDKNSEVPVILVTGYQLSFARAAAKLGGSQGKFRTTTLAKPIHLDKLENAIHELCEPETC